MTGGYILVWDPLSVHWEQIHYEHVSSFDCLQTYTATAETELEEKQKKKQLINSHSTISHHHIHSFYWKESVEKGIILSYPELQKLSW